LKIPVIEDTLTTETTLQEEKLAREVEKRGDVAQPDAVETEAVVGYDKPEVDKPEVDKADDEARTSQAGPGLRVELPSPRLYMDGHDPGLVRALLTLTVRGVLAGARSVVVLRFLLERFTEALVWVVEMGLLLIQPPR
jgi:hypothetical protein